MFPDQSITLETLGVEEEMGFNSALDIACNASNASKQNFVDPKAIEKLMQFVPGLEIRA